MDDSQIDDLKRAMEALYVPLRLGDGFSESAYAALRTALQRTAATLDGETKIPKRCAELLIGLQPALDSSVSLYKEDEVVRIYYAIDELWQLTLDCVVQDAFLKSPGAEKLSP